MRKRNILFLSLLTALVGGNSWAGWQYPGTYVGDGWYQDDGSRFVISARGGASFGMGTIKNHVGAIVTDYYVNPDMNLLATSIQCKISGQCDDWIYAGYGNLSSVPPTKDLETFSFTAGASIGWTIPNRPQWRIEAGWDHIADSDYNASPMFRGEVPLVGGDVIDIAAEVESGSVNSQLSTDVYSVMAFYDFYDGLYKPTRTFIPYVGFGLGYANTETILNLSDPYGDIAYQQELAQYGDVVTTDNGVNVIEFYRSVRTTANVAGVLAVGASYGISENMYFDFGLRMMYLPEIKWGLSNEDNTKHREMFSSENNIYINALIGIRFEF